MIKYLLDIKITKKPEKTFNVEMLEIIEKYETNLIEMYENDTGKKSENHR